MSFSRAERREVLDFFVGVLQKFDDYVFYENIRTHIHKAPALVRKYVLLNCSGDNLLEYFKRRKYFFEVLKLDVALKSKILKKKKYRNSNQRKRSRSQGNSFSLEDAISAEGDSVPEQPLTEEEKERQRNEDFTIKHFTKYFKKHKKVKVDWIGFDEQPTTVKIFLQKYYEKKPRSFFLSYPGDFQIDDEDCVCLRLSQTKPIVDKKCTKSAKPLKSKKLSVKIDPELKKTEDLLNSIKFFVEILRKNALPFPIEKLGGYLSKTTSSVRDHVKFNCRTFRNFLLKNSPKVFLINSEEVSLSDECDKVISEIEKLLNDAVKNILPEDDVTLEDRIDLLLKPKIQQSFIKEENKTESSNTKNCIGKIKNVIKKTEINKTTPVSPTSDELIKITSSKNHKDQVEFLLKYTSDINVKNIDNVCNGEKNLKPTSNSLILLHDFTSQKYPNKESALVKPNTVSSLLKDNKNLSYEKIHGPKSPLLVSKNEIPNNDSNSLCNIETFSSPNSFLTNEKRLKNLEKIPDCIHSIELPLNSNETAEANHNQAVSSSPHVDNLIKTSESNNQHLSLDKTSDPLNSSISHKNDVVMDSNSLLKESESVDVLHDKIISFFTVESNSKESSCESIVEDEGTSMLNAAANSKFYDEVPLERPVPRTEKSECIDTLNDDINWLFEYVSISKGALSSPSTDLNESLSMEDDVINDDMPTFKTEEISEERKFPNHAKESDIVDPLSDNLNLLTMDSDSEESNCESFIENCGQYLENTSQNNVFASLIYHKEETLEGKENHEKCEVVKHTPDIIHKLSEELESNDLNSSNDHCKSSLKNETERKSLRKKCDSGFIEDVSVCEEKTINELCEKMSSSSSYDESSDSALGPMTYQISINSREVSNSDSESIQNENKEVSSFETDTNESDVDFIEESQVSNIEMYVKEHFIPADVISKNSKSELNTELDQVNCDLEIAQLLSYEESDNCNFENETVKSVKPDNEIVNASENSAATETIKCCATEPTIVEKDINSHVQQETLMSEFNQDIITEVTDKEKEQFFNETLSTNDINSEKSYLENNIVNCDNPLDLMQPLIAKIVLLTTDSCLAETKIGSRNQAIYFLKSVFSCNQHDSCTYCFEALCVGEEVSCFVPLPEISHKTWVAFMVSRDDSIKNERINCVNAILQKQVENDLSIGNENLFQKRGNFLQPSINSVFKGISKTVPTHSEALENRAYDISSLNTDFTNKNAAKSIYDDKRRNFESQLHNAEFNVNCDANCFSAFNRISSPVETNEAEIVVNGWKSHRKQSKVLDMKCSTIQNHLPEEECHKISIDKTTVACQTSCFKQSISMQTEIQLKDFGCQTDDSTKLCVSRANQTENAILNEVMCQTELSGEVKAAIQTVSASCQTFSTGQIMITEYYHH